MGRLNIPADNKGINLKCCLCIYLNARKLSGCKSKMFYLIPKQTPITLTLHVVKGKHDVYEPGCLTPKGRTVSASGSATALVLGAAIKLFNFKERIVLKTRTALQMMLAQASIFTLHISGISLDFSKQDSECWEKFATSSIQARAAWGVSQWQAEGPDGIGQGKDLFSSACSKWIC